ncbi:MAG TPA: GNAT family N-acetyltransferase [Acidimicrobiales bacterium]|nr:GNAT family N-acetyltransferase [Acidimicrobiales bacterium]
MPPDVTFRRASSADAEAVASLYLRARHAAVPAIPPPAHADDDVRAFVRNRMIPEREAWVAVDGGAVVGLLVLDGDDIDQLYLEPSRVGEGIGSRMIDLAKSERPAGLELWAFQSNVRALAFYERHGFVAEGWSDGDNEEREPDVRLRWRPAYTHGHHESVLRSHRWRTAENSAAYLLRKLSPGLRVLDVGCGPGTITLDLARRVAPGTVVGVDASAEVIAEAEAACGAQEGVRFAVGDVYALDFEEGSFDVVHAHQLLQHLGDPVAALREMRRVLRPGGTLAVRDSDYGAFTWAPASVPMSRWLELYHEVTLRNGAEADAGRHLLRWVRAAGFTGIEAGSSTWTFADAESRAWWCGLWADRVRQSSFATQAVTYGLADAEELEELAEGFLAWSLEEDGWFVVLHGEVLAEAPRRSGTVRFTDPSRN